MPIPYLITTLLYIVVALLSAVDVSLISLNFLNVFVALRWMRVHFVTLGVLSQMLFGVLPNLVASVSNKPRPAMRWDIWLLVNAGLVTLVAGFAGMTQIMIFVGGTLIFIAASLLLLQLWGMHGGRVALRPWTSPSARRTCEGRHREFPDWFGPREVRTPGLSACGAGSCPRRTWESPR